MKFSRAEKGVTREAQAAWRPQSSESGPTQALQAWRAFSRLLQFHNEKDPHVQTVPSLEQLRKGGTSLIFLAFTRRGLTRPLPLVLWEGTAPVLRAPCSPSCSLHCGCDDSNLAWRPPGDPGPARRDIRWEVWSLPLTHLPLFLISVHCSLPGNLCQRGEKQKEKNGTKQKNKRKTLKSPS